jgi:hypothetical protein
MVFGSSGVYRGFQRWVLTERTLKWMGLKLDSLSRIDTITRSTARKKEKENKYRAFRSKLYSCKITVVDVGAPRKEDCCNASNSDTNSEDFTWLPDNDGGGDKEYLATSLASREQEATQEENKKSR